MTEVSPAHILVLCEKSSQAKKILPAAMKAFPQKKIICFTLTTGVGYSSSGEEIGKAAPRSSPSAFKLKLPRDLPIGQVPIIIDPAHLPITSLNSGLLGHLMDEAEQIVFACDPDPRGVYMFAQHMRKRFGNNRIFPAIKLSSYEEGYLLEEFYAGRTTSDLWFQEQLSLAKAKRFFDVNWAANSLPLFGKLLEDCGSPMPEMFVSKYMIQAFFILSGMRKFQFDVALLVLQEAPGSGKYGPSPIGSASSRVKIIENLQAVGLLEEAGKGVLQFTPVGDEFLKRLHRDCEDGDLAVRLQMWGENWPENRTNMERYIRTYFGKQKKFMSKF